MTVQFPVLFGCFSEGHSTDKLNADWNLYNQNEVTRRYETTEVRLKEIGTFMQNFNDNIKPLLFLLQGGDLCDMGERVAETSLDSLQNALTWLAAGESADGWSGTTHHVWGNHENSLWAADVSDYIGEIDNSGYANTQGVDDDQDPANTHYPYYSFDSGGMHWIVYPDSGRIANISDATAEAWLAADLAATKLPVVFITHYHINSTTEMIDTGSTFARSLRYAEVTTILEAAGNVQVVIQNHWHKGEIWGGGSWVEKNDIKYLNIGGSVLAASDSENRYYIVSIMPNAYQGTSQMCANVQVLGFNIAVGKSEKQFMV